MEWTEEYKRNYREVIRDKLPRSFVAMYEKNKWLHDCYLNSLYIANTGPHLQAYSTRGGTTLQLDFCGHDSRRNLLVIYQNVSRLRVSYRESGDISPVSPTGFGSCAANVFEIGEDGRIHNDYEFIGGDRIEIVCEKIRYQKIVNTYW